MKKIKLKAEILVVGGLFAFLAVFFTALVTIATATTPGPNWFKDFGNYLSSYSDKSKKIIKELTESLSEIKGQEQTKVQVLQSVAGWLEEKENSDSQVGGLVIHLAGNSGLESTIAEKITAAFTGDKNKAINVRHSFAFADPENTKTVAERLLDTASVFNGFQYTTSYSQLYIDLYTNPKGVVRIDDFTRFTEKDDSMEKMLWNVAETGEINISGLKLNCKNNIFILTSNVSPESTIFETDPKRAMHQQAFFDYIDTIYFKEFSFKEYFELIKQKFKNPINYYAEKFNLVLNIPEESINKVAKELKEQKVGGARNIRKYLKNLYAVLEKFKRDYEITEYSEDEPRVVTLKYDEKLKSFVAN